MDATNRFFSHRGAKFLLRSHALKKQHWGSSSNSDSDDDDRSSFATESSWDDSAAAAGLITPSSTTPLSSHRPAFADEPSSSSAAPAPPAAAVCEFKEVSAKLKGSATAQVDLQARYDINPHVVFSLLADPTQHAHIFDAIEVCSVWERGAVGGRA